MGELPAVINTGVALAVALIMGVVCGVLITQWQSQRRFRQKEQELNGIIESEAKERSTSESLSRQLAELAAQYEIRRQELEAGRIENAKQMARIASMETALLEQGKHAEEKLALLVEAKEKMSADFKTMANEIFESREKVFKRDSKAQLTNLLDPLSTRIKEFEKRVEDSYSKESKERFSLIQQVRNLQDINDRISKEAVNLTNALKGENKTQGSWGEVILERVLEKSGLQRGREYEIQVSMRNDEGRRRQPDVVVHLPEGKDVVIDAKVSLTDYERYSSASNELDRQQAIKNHVQSLRRHLKQLGEKDYQQLAEVNSLDFVLLFIPVEAAFAAAVQHDGELFSDGFEKNIVIVSPSTLLATLRIIQNIWRYEYQNRNAQEIADKAGGLYDKFVNFVKDLETIGSRIDSTRTAYQDAHNKLVSGRGSLVNRAETMRELGAKVSKSLPENLVELPRRESEIVPYRQEIDR